MKKNKIKEKVIQIAFVENNCAPVCLTNKGRILIVNWSATSPFWEDITPEVEKIKKALCQKRNCHTQ